MLSLGTFICEQMKSQRINKSELVSRLGYANINKGLRALDKCVREGVPHPFVVQNLHKALNVEPSIVEEFVRKTKKERLDHQEAIERKNFRPHLWIITERRIPTQITIAILTGMTEKRIKLPPDITALAFDSQLEIAKSVVREHYAVHGGSWRFFGKIVGYYYFHHFRENVRLDVDGNVEKRETTSFQEPEGYLIIGNKRISGGLFKFTDKDYSNLELNKSQRVDPVRPE
jgi:hypothetical protein